MYTKHCHKVCRQEKIVEFMFFGSYQIQQGDWHNYYYVIKSIHPYDFKKHILCITFFFVALSSTCPGPSSPIISERRHTLSDPHKNKLLNSITSKKENMCFSVGLQCVFNICIYQINAFKCYCVALKSGGSIVAPEWKEPGNHRDNGDGKQCITYWLK